VAEWVESDTEALEAARPTTTVDRGAEVLPAPSVRRDLPVPPPPDLDRHVEELDPAEVFALINPQMLYGKHLGLGGSVRAQAERGDEKYEKLRRAVSEVQAEAIADGTLPIRAVWRFYPARSEGNRLALRDPDNGHTAASWELPRQAKDGGLCLADYVLEGDHVALFVTTAGNRVRQRVAELKEAGEYLKSHILAAVALESAEAAAELVHRRLRALWGFPDPESLADRDLFAARYRGKRYSFGYPACPDLAGQRDLFAALAPGAIGVELTDGDMMDPEASVSALVFHHPDARYFGVE